MADEVDAIVVLRRRLLGLFALGACGTVAELLLLGHTEGPWQLLPLVLLCAALLSLACCAALRSAAGARAFRLLMPLLLAAGGAGLWLHVDGNAEFERELYPQRKGLELLWEALSGATPALAPGMLVVLGLLGLLAMPRMRAP